MCDQINMFQYSNVLHKHYSELKSEDSSKEADSLPFVALFTYHMTLQFYVMNQITDLTSYICIYILLHGIL